MDNFNSCAKRYLMSLVLALSLIALLAAPAAAYNPSAAVSYADQWWNGTNSGPPRYYVRFSANDCTNYISQALRAGSLAPISSYPSPGASYNQKQVDVRNWFWDPDSSVFTQYSYSWTSADYLMRHAYSYIGWRFQPVSYFAYLDAGDFFVMDLVGNGQATHGRFVVGWGYDSIHNQYGLITNQHTTDRYHILYDEFWNPNTTTNWKIQVL